MSNTERNRHHLIDEMERLYLQRAWSDQEMADRVGTGRENVWRIRTQVMEARMGIPFITENGRHRIDATFYTSHIKLKPAEAMALYIAGRRLQQQTKTGQLDVANALEKLAKALRKPLAENLVRAASVVLEQEQDAQQTQNLRQLIDAWINGRRVRIQHRKPHGELRTYIVSPYQLEPAVWGDGIYLIGHSDYHNSIASFKLARIEHITPTTEPFDVPEDFDSHRLLQFAWGIWHADEQPVTVRLKFSRYVTPRVKETIWHPEQTIQDLPDGNGCIWQAEIAEWREIRPWVRGWGSDVEVLEPEELREELKQTAVRLNKLYQTMTTITRLPHQLPYAKTNPGNRDEVHLLLYHLIDVGQATLVMWQEVLTNSIRQRLADILHLTVEQAGQFIAFLAALHDLGKAGPAYQKKYGPEWLKDELKGAGLGLDGMGKAYETSTPHGTVSTWALIEMLPQLLGLDERFARQIAVAVGGHHGSWPPPGAEERIDDSKFPLWAEVRRDLVWEVQAVFKPPTTVIPPSSPVELNAFLTIFSGLVSVADWVGSRNKECFGFIEQPIPTRQYAARSVQKARQSLADLGWLGWLPDGRTLPFTEAFAYLPEIKEPRGVQADVIAAAQNISAPTLLILEAPTGIGKTETAVYLADCWLQQNQGRGLYVAMPTQATSNQMYGRIGDFLNHRYADSGKHINFHLVHGQAAWQDELKDKVELQRVGDDELAHVLAESWFIPRKRTLLAPFGVGTVDQTLMSILQTRHFFVRLFGLSHKVIIFDEVHAYDTFMSTLFYRLLQWLSAIGTSVIILSATLPAETRRKLVTAYSDNTLPEAAVPYPSLTIATPDHDPQTIPLARPKDVTLQLNWAIGREPADILAYLQEELASGGCAAVICNTVRRAQDIYRILNEARQAGTLDIDQDNLILFHARFPPIWRQEIEADVLRKFGKPDKDGHSPHRPHKAVVVATQVIEQSLDLDFDLMITDLAPIDLIIQRAGRLHRHDRKERYGHGRCLRITQAKTDEVGIPDFENDRYVYELFVLFRSYLVLQRQSEIQIPGDTTRLIEAVYGEAETDIPLSLIWQEALHKSRRTLDDNRHEAEFKATSQLVLSPDNRRLLKQSMLDLDEESPEVHETFRAQTRDIDPGISLICLHREANSLFLFAKEGKIAVSLEEDVPPYLIRQYQQNMINVQHKGVFHHFVNQSLPLVWQKQAALRYCRPIIFQDGVYEMDAKYTLHLSREYGLEIIKKEDV
jgi:CRISPR-associated endonuclease/helicase Cas3